MEFYATGGLFSPANNRGLYDGDGGATRSVIVFWKLRAPETLKLFGIFDVISKA